MEILPSVGAAPAGTLAENQQSDSAGRGRTSRK